MLSKLSQSKTVQVFQLLAFQEEKKSAAYSKASAVQQVFQQTNFIFSTN
jgi:hypothetical protein